MKSDREIWRQLHLFYQDWWTCLWCGCESNKMDSDTCHRCKRKVE